MKCVLKFPVTNFEYLVPVSDFRDFLYRSDWTRLATFMVLSDKVIWTTTIVLNIVSGVTVVYKYTIFA